MQPRTGQNLWGLASSPTRHQSARLSNTAGILSILPEVRNSNPKGDPEAEHFSSNSQSDI